MRKQSAPAPVWSPGRVREWAARHGGNVSALARRLAIGRTNLQSYATDPSAVRWRPLPPYIQAHMRTLDGIAAWLDRWRERVPPEAAAELEAVLRGESPGPPDTELTRRMDSAG